MKPITLFDVALPTFINGLTQVHTFIDAAVAHAESKKVNPDHFMHERLIVDQFAFAKQVQATCDAAKLCAAKIAGIEAPKYDDTEATLAELKTRIENTLVFLKTVTPEQFNGNESKVIPMSWMPEMGIRAQEYVIHYSIPNFFFHMTTAYQILRTNGVSLGKADFMGKLPLEPIAA